MTRSPLTRLGLTAVACLLAVTAPATPAHAAGGGIVGRVTTATGAPAADIRVTVYNDHVPDYHEIASTTTDADGRYTLAGPATGAFTLSFTDATGLVQWAPGRTDHDDAARFAVTTGHTTTVDNRLLPTGTITGRFTHPDGAALGAVTVVAEHEGSASTSQARLGADGRYTLPVLTGEHTVEFQLPNAHQWAPQARTADAATRYRVTAGQAVTVDDTLLPSGSIGGTILDAKGKAAGSTGVRLHLGRDMIREITTTATGKYTLPNVLTGSYQLEFAPTRGSAQWAPGALSRRTARSYRVTAGTRTTVNDKLLPVGTITGTFRKTDGKPYAGIVVEALPQVGGRPTTSAISTTTNAKGVYRLSNMTVGSYTVTFTDKTRRTQFAYGKGSRGAAARVSVKAGKTTTVNDKQVPAATLKITAKDAKTGTALTNFCVTVSPAENNRTDTHDACTKGSQVVIKNLGAETHTVQVTPESAGTLQLPATTTVAVKTGQTKSVAVALPLGGAITTTATDRATGAPVKSACILPLRTGRGGNIWGGRPCTDATGNVRSQTVAPGTYNVLVNPQAPYGKQWIGTSGGTGDQRAAAVVTVTAGSLTPAPAILLDRGGSITGTVRTPAGRPVQYGEASISAWDRTVTLDDIGRQGSPIDSHGRYTLTDLGPYHWPLIFDAAGRKQWSGNTGNRFAATTVAVTAGSTVTHDETIGKGVAVRSTIRGTAIESATLFAYHAVTGDLLATASADVGRPVTLTVPGDEQIKIRYEIDAGTTLFKGWYDRAKDSARAKAVTVPATGPVTIDIKVP